MKRAEIARRMGVHPSTVSARIARGDLPVVRKPRQGRTIALDPALASVLARVDGAGPVRVPAWSWALLLELLPAVTPSTLAYEVAGALRAAVGGAGVGRRRVDVDDRSADRLTSGTRSAKDRTSTSKAVRRR